MTKIRILGNQEIQSLITISLAIESVENAYRQKHEGTGRSWPMLFHEFRPGRADLDIKPGNLYVDGIFGLKLLTWYADNPAKGIPALLSTSFLFDITTGEPRALLNAAPVTYYRTGAAAAIGAKYLARPNSESMVLVGVGPLAPYLVASVIYAMPDLKKVTIVNPHTPEKAGMRLEDITSNVDIMLANDHFTRIATIEASEDTEAAVREADIIVTATNTYEPVIKDTWVKPGAHLSCIGSDVVGKQEVESKLLGRARVFGDDEKQCHTIGECEKPYQQRIMSGIEAEIGALIAGDVKGRFNDKEVTLFDSTGISLQDLATASALVTLAEKRGVGTIVEL